MRPRPEILSATIYGFLLMLMPPSAIAQTEDPCFLKGTRIIADTIGHVLWLCEDSKKINSFRIAIGQNGTGKKEHGDQKTPLGFYPLELPYASEEFTYFIPIGYPTPEQRTQGYRGGDVGIHGVKTGQIWTDDAMLDIDWTNGCIAVTTNAIKEIAAWVRSKGPSGIEIR